MRQSIQFRVLAESSLNGIYLIQDDLFLYVNPALARMFGYTVEEVVDRLSPSNLVYPVDRPLVRENIRRPLEGDVEEIRYEFQGLRKDGSAFPVEGHGRRIEHGGKTGVMGMLVDITERRRAEDELRASEQRFRDYAEIASDWFWESPITRSPIFLERRQTGRFLGDSLARDVGSSLQTAKTSQRSGALTSPRSMRTSLFAASGTKLHARTDRRSTSRRAASPYST